MVKIIYGCGTGRCGTTSLAKLFEKCKNVHVAHYCPVDGKLTQSNMSGEIKYIVSINPNNINKIPPPKNAKIICLKRDKAGTTESFIKMKYPHNKESVEKYWKEYYISAENFEIAYRDNFKIFDIDKLNSKEGLKEIFDFVGIDEEDRVYTIKIRENERKRQ